MFGKAKPEEVGENVSGKIALVERGDITFVEKVQNVLNKGAVGVFNVQQLTVQEIISDKYQRGKIYLL